MACFEWKTNLSLLWTIFVNLFDFGNYNFSGRQAYACETKTLSQMREYRGTLKEPGKIAHIVIAV